MPADNYHGEIHQVSQAIGAMQAQLNAITQEVLRYHTAAEVERAEMRAEVQVLRKEVRTDRDALRRQIEDLTALRNKGLGVGGVLLFIAGLLGWKIQKLLEPLIGGGS